MTSTCTRIVDLNREGRDFVVGDVHGCFRTLDRALTALAFDPSRDRLFGVGTSSIAVPTPKKPSPGSRPGSTPSPLETTNVRTWTGSRPSSSARASGPTIGFGRSSRASTSAGSLLFPRCHSP